MASADTKVALDNAPDVLESNTILVVDQTTRGEGYVVLRLDEDESDPETPYRITRHEINSLTPALEPYVIRKCPEHLSPSMAAVHVIVSGRSGTGLAPKAWELVVEPLLELIQTLEGGNKSTPQTSYKVLFTENTRSISDFARSNLGIHAPKDCRPPMVILLSGDGGVVELLNGCPESAPSSSHPVISSLPFGTGNALFHSIHKPLYHSLSPTPLVLGLRTLWKGTPHPLPTFKASFSPGAKIVRPADQSGGIPLSNDNDGVDHLLGAVVASYGLHSNIVWESDTPEYRKHGAQRFSMVATNLLQENHAYSATVSIRTSSDAGVDTFHPLQGAPKQFSYVLAAQVSNLEKAFEISPETTPLDQALRLVYFGPVGAPRTMEIMGAVYAGGKHLKMEEVGYVEILGLEVKTTEQDSRWRKVCIDGTIVELEEGGWMRVERLKEPYLKILSS
ncbi:hypothetical protein jhhlp_003591 [Lomentospora prolificans]|uniref:DAGKc domain-containing protein n=1 Tax=Lomentospora prolificans TaxID=41688 RepID=A0A2N3N956_9PEZI|nr:hypothetical protein jhhlp_003591 [Lomentospora prolificans]